jgi:hypothetical protein
MRQQRPFPGPEARRAGQAGTPFDMYLQESGIVAERG